MVRNRLSLSLIFASAVAALPVLALERVSLEPIEHRTASLTVASGTQSQTFTPAQLESLGATRVVTTTPWREEPATFDGVLLQDLLSVTGMADAPGIRVIAENDFAIEMPREVWESTPILVATRVDGRPHTRRERGPIQFVIPMEVYADNENLREAYWVWMAARIEPLN